MADFLYDGTNDFGGGQNSSIMPDNLPENQYEIGINLSTRRTSLLPRWGLDRKELTFPDCGIKNALGEIVSFKRIFESGKFQALIPYHYGVEDYLIVIFNGIIFFINVNTYQVTIIDLPTTKINPRVRRLNWSLAGKYIVIFDFQDYPIIIEGLEARRANPDEDEIPVSVMGCYNQNRLFIGNIAREFTAGDAVGNTATPNSPITFKEVLTPGSTYYKQAFQLDTQYSDEVITAMGFLQVADTSTGIGSLIVGTKNGLYSYRTNQPRANWTTGQFGGVILFNSGIVGPRAIINVNSDLFFLSPDNQLRSLSMSRNEQEKWNRIPLSREVRNWMFDNDPALTNLSFLHYFGNKVFVSAKPFRCEASTNEGQAISDYAFGGLAVLELDNMGTMLETPNPAWAGLWTGVRPMDMTTANGRCFVISKDDKATNRLYEFLPDQTYDTYKGKIRLIKSKIWTREFTFKDTFILKDLHSMEVQMESISGEFNLNVAYKPSHLDTFVPWQKYQYSAPWRTCKVPSSVEVNGFAKHQIREIPLGTPDKTICDPVFRNYSTVFKKVQFSIDISAIAWELNAFLIRAIPFTGEQRLTEDFCQLKDPVTIPTVCYDFWSVEEF